MSTSTKVEQLEAELRIKDQELERLRGAAERTSAHVAMQRQTIMGLAQRAEQQRLTIMQLEEACELEREEGARRMARAQAQWR